jgi:predicted TIM-barrel fold metal-dependent hydrolase
MRLDVSAFLGAYPFRRVPGTSPDALLRAMDRVAVDQAWVTHLPSVFWRDPAAGNPWLYETTQREDRFRPVPAVHPGLAGWEQVLSEAKASGAPAVRCDPTYYGIDPVGPEMRAISRACASEGLPLMLAVRLEDARQRHPNDRASELPPWAVRTLIRSDPSLRLVVTHADRGFIEEVHFGSTPEESGRIWWDICWIWGPPEDHLETLIRTIGVKRLVFGTGQPLRLPEVSVAKLDLLDLTGEQRGAIESGNAAVVIPSPSALRAGSARGRSSKQSSAPSRSLS